MQLIVLNQRDEYVRHIRAINTVRKGEHEGFDVLEFGTDFRGLEKDYRILAQMPTLEWQEFIVRSLEEKAVGVIVSCENSFNETYGDYIQEREPTTNADGSLDVVLEYTRWTRSKTMDYETPVTKMNFYRCSVREAVSIIQETFNVVARTSVTISGNSIVSRNVWFENPAGRNLGYRYESGRNATDIVRTVEEDSVISCLYGYGKGLYYPETGGYSRAIDFSSINDGKAYVEDVNVTAHYGRQVFGKVEFPDVEDVETLYLLTLAELANRNTPKVTYTGKMVDLKLGDSIELGEQVTVIDEDLDIRIVAQVLQKEEYLDREEDNVITIGNAKREYADVNRNKSISDIKKLLYSDPTRGGLSSTIAYQIENTLSAWNEKINDGMMSGHITALPGGLLFEDVNSAMHVGAQGIRIASTKNADGTWKWRTFGTGEGLGAELVTGDQFIAGTILARIANLEYIQASDIRVTGGITLTGKLESIADDIENIELTPGPKGEDAITVHIDSVNGNIFKNSSIATTLVVSVISGDKWIQNNADLIREYGEDAFLQWSEKVFGSLVYENVPLSDSRISDNGFIFTISPNDIETKSTFKCDLYF